MYVRFTEDCERNFQWRGLLSRHKVFFTQFLLPTTDKKVLVRLPVYRVPVLGFEYMRDSHILGTPLSNLNTQ